MWQRYWSWTHFQTHFIFAINVRNDSFQLPTWSGVATVFGHRNAQHVLQQIKRRHTSRPYINSVRQCSNRARQNVINWTSRKNVMWPACVGSVQAWVRWRRTAWHRARLTDRRLARPDFGPTHLAAVRVRSVQTDWLSSVARLYRRTFDILVRVDRFGRSINCTQNAVRRRRRQPVLKPLSPIHTADADETKLSSLVVASASAVCTWIRDDCRRIRRCERTTQPSAVTQFTILQPVA